ncbi:MAG: hypothetical protein H7332_12405 [Bdellovibrionales bacterium]|nr:hypothetical protein [Ramlibacter sp.]
MNTPLINSAFKPSARPLWNALSSTPMRMVLATTAALWLGAAQAQPGAPGAPHHPVNLSLADFFRQPAGPRGLEISDALQRANGSAVRLVGYMVQQEEGASGRFILANRPVQMSERADGAADDLPPAAVMVYLDPAQRDWLVPHVRGLVAVSGVLQVGRHEETDGRVSWVRLQLAPEAVQAAQAAQAARPVETSALREPPRATLAP